MSDQQTKYVNYEAQDPAMVVADKLAEQLGSDPSSLEMGATDMRRLSVLYPDAVVPLLYCKIRARKSRAFRSVFNEYLNLMVSTDGRGRRDIIRMEMASKSGSPNVDSEIRKPNWFVRNITNRNWEEEERKRLGA